MPSGGSILKLLSSLRNLFLRQEFSSILAGLDRREVCAKHVRHGAEEARWSYTLYQFLMQPMGLYKGQRNFTCCFHCNCVTCVDSRPHHRRQTFAADHKLMSSRCEKMASSTSGGSLSTKPGSLMGSCSMCL